MENTTIITEKTANPAPLGLLGFGMTTILLNIHNAGFGSIDAMIIGMGICMGGFAQIIAGIQEWKKNNTFGATAFTAYGMFWLALVMIWVIPNIIPNTLAPTATSVGFFLTIWGIFTGMMFLGTLQINRALQAVFGSLTVLFFLLAISDFTGSGILKTIAGREGIFCGLSALYTCVAQILNEVYNKTILPLGTIEKKQKQ